MNETEINALIGRVMEWPEDWAANVEPCDIAARCRTLVQEALALASPVAALAGEREALQELVEAFDMHDLANMKRFHDAMESARAVLASRPTTQAPEPASDDGASTRFQAELNGPFMAANDLARRVAFAGRDKHDYLPQTIEAAKTWTPHDWVIRAMRDYAEAMVLQTPVAATQAPEAQPVAFVPMHPRNGPLWTQAPAEPYAYEFAVLIQDSMPGWETQMARKLPKHSEVRDVKPLFLAPSTPVEVPSVFTPSEVKYLGGSPEALRAAADYHDVQATEASSIDPEMFAGCVDASEARAKELRALADQIEKEF